MRMPTIDVLLDGRRVDSRLLTLRVSEKLSQPTQAEVTFSGTPQGVWPLGSSLTIAVERDELFAGEVTAVETIHHPGSERAWIVRAYDRLHKLRKRQTPRVFEDVSLSDLADQLTGEEVECAPTARIPRLVQHRQSDWELLKQTAARCGRYVVLTGQGPRIIDLRPQGQPLQLSTQDVWQLRVEANTDGVYGSVTAIGWHPQQGEFVTEKASSDEDGQRTLVDQSPTLLAEAAHAAVSRTRLSLEGIARGNTELRPGRAITAEGVAGAHTVTSTVHTVNVDGYQTRFSTERPPSPTSSTGASITLGRVTSVRGGDGRVRVSLPAYGDIDAGWLGVLCPGAGPGKGIVALPDPDDLVLIALPHENPAEGIVLGAVYGPANPPDHGVEGDRVRRWTLHSSGGQTIVIDDDRKALKLSNADGSSLELAPDLVSLTAKTDLVIEAPGHHLSIRAAKVDFEHAVLP